MEGKDLLLQLEDQNALLEKRVVVQDNEISSLLEELRRRDQALEKYASPLRQTPLPERGRGSDQAQELSGRVQLLESERRTLKSENKALVDIDARKNKALDELDATIASLEEERDVRAVVHAQEVAQLRARAAEAGLVARRYEELEREHAALSEECASLNLVDGCRVRDWVAERRRLKEEVHHERQAKIAAQDNAATLRAKYVAAREQLDSLRVSLRNCPPSKQTPQQGHDAVLVLSPPFGAARAAGEAAGGVAAVEAADEPGRPAVPYEIFAQVEAEVRLLRRRAAGGAGCTPSPAKPPRNLLGAPAWMPPSSGPRAAGSAGRPTSSPSPTGARTRASEVELPVGHPPGGAVSPPDSPYLGLSNHLNDLVRSVSELTTASATRPLPRVDLFGARSLSMIESDGWPQLAMAETGSPAGPAEDTAAPPGKKVGSAAAGKTSFPVNWRR